MWEQAATGRYRIYVTRNTQYHVFDGECVAVCDRATGRWQPQHAAIGLRLEGGLRVETSGLVAAHDVPQVGDRLCFSLGTRAASILTSEMATVLEGDGRDMPVEPFGERRPDRRAS